MFGGKDFIAVTAKQMVNDDIVRVAARILMIA
jgi:hypothetical protein